MLLMGLFVVLFAVFDSLAAFAVPVVPTEVVTVVDYIFNMISSGIDILAYMFVDMALVSAIVKWIVVAFGLLFTFDLIFTVIRYVKSLNPVS